MRITRSLQMQCGTGPRIAGSPLLCEQTSLMAVWHQEFRCICKASK